LELKGSVERVDGRSVCSYCAASVFCALIFSGGIGWFIDGYARTEPKFIRLETEESKRGIVALD
jgi:hypothetical protein